MKVIWKVENEYKNREVLFVRKMNRAGQALVEFVIILPIFIFMMFAVIDLGKILYFQNNLESKMEEVITSYETVKNVDVIEKKLNLGNDYISLEINKKDSQFVEFQLKRKMDIITPGLNLIFGSVYDVTVKRVIYDES